MVYIPMIPLVTDILFVLKKTEMKKSKGKEKRSSWGKNHMLMLSRSIFTLGGRFFLSSVTSDEGHIRLRQEHRQLYRTLL